MSFCFATCVCPSACDTVRALWWRLKIDTQRLQNRPSEGSKSSQNRPGTSRSCPERPKSVPSASQERPRAPQERSKSAQERHKSAQERPKSAQERPKSVPRAPQERPRAPQERPGECQDAAQGAPGSPQGPFRRLQARKKSVPREIRRATRSRIPFGMFFRRFSKRARKSECVKNL